MSLQTVAIAAVAVVYFLIRYFNRTDVPKIKGLPEIPGVPIFGNLIQLGDQHATVAAKWAKKFGPVFQVRMGNRVSLLVSQWEFMVLTTPARYFRQHFRLCPSALDQGSVRPRLPTNIPHLPQRCF